MTEILESIELNGEKYDDLLKTEESSEEKSAELPENLQTTLKSRTNGGVGCPQEAKTDDHFAILSKIRGYTSRYKDCKNIDISKIDKMNLQELILKLEECKSVMANRPSSQIHRLAFKAALQGTEQYVAPMLGMNLRGFAATANEDEEIMDTLDEIALLQDWKIKSMPPEARLCMGLGMLAMKVNAHNKKEQKELKLPENSEDFDDC